MSIEINLNKEYIYYGFCDEEGILLKIEKEISNGYYCGEYTYTLTIDEDCPEFLVDTEQAANYVSTFNTPWYNSSETKPSHGSINLVDYSLVKVHKTVMLEVLEKPVIKNLSDLNKNYIINAFSDKRYKYYVINDLPRSHFKIGDLYWSDYEQSPKAVFGIEDAPLFYVKEYKDCFTVMFKLNK